MKRGDIVVATEDYWDGVSYWEGVPKGRQGVCCKVNDDDTAWVTWDDEDGEPSALVFTPMSVLAPEGACGTEWPFTILGRQFFDGQLPRLIGNIGRLADELKRYNDNLERAQAQDAQEDPQPMATSGTIPWRHE